jgi:hypothetical protein
MVILATLVYDEDIRIPRLFNYPVKEEPVIMAAKEESKDVGQDLKADTTQ